jgi:hypothetical protein
VVEGVVDFNLVFLLEWEVCWWWLLEDVFPGSSNMFEDVVWVRDGFVSVCDGLESSGVFVFEVGVAFVFVVLEIVFPLVESVVSLLLFFVGLRRKEGVNDALALSGSSGWGRDVLDGVGDFGAEFVELSE